MKNDPDSKGTIRLWNEIFSVIRWEYPEAKFVSEWGEPDKALKAGFGMEFLLHFGPSHYPDLFRTEHPYFAKEGKGNIHAFFDLHLKNREKTTAMVSSEQGPEETAPHHEEVCKMV